MLATVTTRRMRVASLASASSASGFDDVVPGDGENDGMPGAPGMRMVVDPPPQGAGPLPAPSGLFLHPATVSACRNGARRLGTARAGGA